jgi:hypothetical protein
MCELSGHFSETKKTRMAGVKTPVSVIWHVLKARTEGMGCNAAARPFEKAKNTILSWERKFLDLQQVLFLSALVHECFEGVIEGPEACPSRSVTRVDHTAHGPRQSMHGGVSVWQEGSKTLAQGDQDIGQDCETDA